jgi:outer membrane biosynthesis protein TonB
MALTANSENYIPAYDTATMTAPLVKSGIFHVALLLVFAVGLPFVSPPKDMTIAPIIVELVDISDVTATPRIAPPVKPKEDPPPPEPAQKVEAQPRMVSERPPELPKPTPPEIKPIEKPPEPEPEPPKPLERTPEKKPEPPKSKEPPKPKKEEPPPKPKEDDFQSLLRNIIPETAKPVEGDTETKTEAEPQPSQIAQLSDQLSISEQDTLIRQLAGCWNVMAGARYAEELIVEIRVEINRDRTVNRAAILDQGRYNRDNHFRAAADAALRALRNPKCIPLALPPDKYDQWKTTLIRFDPRDML